MYPLDSVVYLLKSGPGVDQLPSVSTVMSPKNYFYKTNLPSVDMYLFLTTKAPSSPPLSSPLLSACLHINCDMEVAKAHA